MAAAVSSLEEQTEEVCWLSAAYKVLDQARRPLHYTDIKRIILDLGLTPPGMRTTLEAALCREAQSSKRRVGLVPGQPGVFSIASCSQPVAAQIKTEAKVSEEGPHRRRDAAGGGKRNAAKMQEKYRRMKRWVKDLMFTNAAVCDEVVRIEEKIAMATEERRYLLRRVMQRQSIAEPASPPAPPPHGPRAALAPTAPAAAAVAGKPSDGHKFSVPHPPPPPAPGSNRSVAGSSRGVAVSSLSSSAGVGSEMGGPAGRPVASQSIAQLLGEVDKRQKKCGGVKRPRGVDDTLSSPNLGFPGAGAMVKGDARGTKRSRPLPPNRRRLVTSIALDANGRPIFPIELGDLVIYCLGRIVALPGYHTRQHIFPIGFCSTRLYLSINTSPSRSSLDCAPQTCLYTCNIKDGGVSGARFEICPEDTPGLVFAGATPCECHRALLEAINAAWGAGTVPVAPKGTEFFGLAHATVQHLIQSCVGARRCADYEWVKFESDQVGSGSDQSELGEEDDSSVSLAALFKSGFAASLGGVMMNH